MRSYRSLLASFQLLFTMNQNRHVDVFWPDIVFRTCQSMKKPYTDTMMERMWYKCLLFVHDYNQHLFCQRKIFIFYLSVELISVEWNAHIPVILLNASKNDSAYNTLYISYCSSFHTDQIWIHADSSLLLSSLLLLGCTAELMVYTRWRVAIFA